MGRESGDPSERTANEISGGWFFHAVIQGRDITVQLPPRIPPALSGLPQASTTFTGRDTQVGELLKGLAPSREQQAWLVTAVAGLAGIGKTELVVQTALRALQEPGWFPGGVLFIDMFGYDPKRRLSPEQALDGLLRALGMPSEHVPADLQDRSRLYRSVLAGFAEQGKRILVIIDNISTDDQADPLLPTDGRTAALLTSRDTPDVGARLLDLDILNPDASIALLQQALDQARPGDMRVTNEPEAAATIARLCAGLPLALRIAAALLADFVTRPLASLAKALDAQHTRLHRLRRKERAVQAAFDLSYQHLGADHARLFRLLPLNAGPDLSTAAAAQLADTDPLETEELLADLARAHLIEPEASWGRWRMHDLVRLYAADLAQQDDVEHAQAFTRLLNYYTSTLHASLEASELVPSSPGASLTPRFTDPNEALTWLRIERVNLTAAVEAAAARHPDITVNLALGLATVLHRWHHFDDYISVARAALPAALEASTMSDVAALRSSLGISLHYSGRDFEALEESTESVRIYRVLAHENPGTYEPELGRALANLAGRDSLILEKRRKAAEEAVAIGRRWVTGDESHLGKVELGGALNNLRGILSDLGSHGEALECAREAVEIRRREAQLAPRVFEPHLAQMLLNLGCSLSEADRHEEALASIKEGVTLYLRLAADDPIAHRPSLLWALGLLGVAFHNVGNAEEAIEAATRAAALAAELKNQHSEASALIDLSFSLCKTGRFEEAIEAATRAATLATECKKQHSEVVAMINLSWALGETSRFEEAIEAATRAATLAAELNDPDCEASALNNLSWALGETSRFEEAIEAATRAATLAAELNDPDCEASALNNLSWALGETSRFEEAIEAATRAATLAAELNDRKQEHDALINLSWALDAVELAGEI
ncbi:tetratricopeptide repeat protein [Streptomyces sp. NPDC101112]|uniref:tetratricopeptide repeat protein n=1 Tax=Streptomyces sp. NPDC101112 TaxID=3366105 RepID=UPI00382E512D